MKSRLLEPRSAHVCYLKSRLILNKTFLSICMRQCVHDYVCVDEKLFIACNYHDNCVRNMAHRYLSKSYNVTLHQDLLHGKLLRDLGFVLCSKPLSVATVTQVIAHHSVTMAQ